MSKDISMGLPREGMDMLSTEEDLRDGAWRRLRNVDVTNEGIVRRRKGLRKISSRAGLHSLYGYGMFLLFVDRGELMLFTPETKTATVLGFVGDQPLSYAEYNGALYLTNILGCYVLRDRELRRVGVVNDYVGGLPFALPPHDPTKDWTHKVSVAVSKVDDYGEESGAVVVGECELQCLPDSGIVGDLRIYATSGVSGTWVRVGSVEPCEVLGCEPLPAGHYIDGHNGRLCVAVDNCLVFSEALRPHLYDPATNVIPFVGRIRMLKSNGDVLYVADDRGVWVLKGKDLLEASLEQASSAIIVDGSALVVPSSALPSGRKDMPISEGETFVVFLTEFGFVGGRSNGTLENLSRGFVKSPTGMKGCTVLLERDGVTQLVSTINASPFETVGVASDAAF